MPTFFLFANRFNWIILLLGLTAMAIAVVKYRILQRQSRMTTEPDSLLLLFGLCVVSAVFVYLLETYRIASTGLLLNGFLSVIMTVRPEDTAVLTMNAARLARTTSIIMVMALTSILIAALWFYLKFRSSVLHNNR